ncbi:MAG TPA: CsbD family protein [bacterium]|nr:CsbD family protein [bacterium]
MNPNNEDLKGSANSAVGSIKEAAGRTTGNRRLEEEGVRQKTKGQVQKLAGAVKNVVKKGKTLLGAKSDGE